jgi:putative ABC transport system substrate-binding protein
MNVCFWHLAAVLWNAANPYSANVFKETQTAARRFGIEVQSLEVRSPDDFDGAFEDARRRHPDALIEVEDPLTNSLHRRIVEFAAAEQLPSLHGVGEEVKAGGLISYGASIPDLFRRAAGYVDKILKGDMSGSGLLPCKLIPETHLIGGKSLL